MECKVCKSIIINSRIDKKYCSAKCKNKSYSSSITPEYRSEYYKKNKVALLEKQKQYKLKNKEYLIFKDAKYRSIKKNIDFNIEITDIVIPKKCPLLGIDLKFDSEKGRQNYTPSIDRIDPDKGYTKGNVWIISWKANRIKSTLNGKELRLFCHRVIERINKNG